ncbi:MAG: transketolase [Candidatus Levybacteria bacterium]|nr:transketolase [Candidatus Levybacteria bacterium]
MQTNHLAQKATLVRAWSLKSTTAAGSGHPTTCMSAADLATVLFDKYFRYDLKNPLFPGNDRFILSKGHAAPLLYTLFALSGAFPVEDLLTLRQFNSPLEGHPTPNFAYSDAATGSLGQGVSIGAGLAYVAKNEKLPYKTYVLTGDGELAEGQVWEALNFASYYKLDNLIILSDINRLGQSQPTMFEHHIDEYVGRFRAFGAEVIAIDGHDVVQIDKALLDATQNTTGKPYVVVAKTLKGKGVSFLEDTNGWHGKPLKKDDLEKALKELGEVDESLRFQLKEPQSVVIPNLIRDPKKMLKPSRFAFGEQVQNDSSYAIGDEVATREVYGKILADIAKEDSRIYALDAEVKNSTYSLDFMKAIPDRFVECFIAEQNMVGVAVGMSRIGKKPFVSTFAAFLTRAFDQIRMGAIGHANITFVGSHSGVSIGEDGSSQMGLEDIAMFGTIPEAVVLHPSDAVSTAKLLPLLAVHKGISYLRTLRPKTPVLYKNDATFTIGGSKILRFAQDDILTIVAAGITVHEALKAYEELKKKRIHVRIVDCYSIKPIDKPTLLSCLDETKQKIIVTVEDHYEHGGLGDFVLSAVSQSDARVEKLAVKKFSRSGKPELLLKDAGIDAENIVKTVEKLLA